MQKIHDPKLNNAHEYEIDIKNDAKYIISIYNTYKRILNHFKDVHYYLLRFENKVFKTNEVEIKLTRQFGNEEIYSFEIESLTDGVDLEKKCKELGLFPDYSANTDEFWINFNKRVNVDISTLGDKELEEILANYI